MSLRRRLEQVLDGLNHPDLPVRRAGRTRIVDHVGLPYGISAQQSGEMLFRIGAPGLQFNLPPLSEAGAGFEIGIALTGMTETSIVRAPGTADVIVDASGDQTQIFWNTVGSSYFLTAGPGSKWYARRRPAQGTEIT